MNSNTSNSMNSSGATTWLERGAFVVASILIGERRAYRAGRVLEVTTYGVAMKAVDRDLPGAPRIIEIFLPWRSIVEFAAWNVQERVPVVNAAPSHWVLPEELAANFYWDGRYGIFRAISSPAADPQEGGA